MFNDSLQALALAKNKVHHNASKHIKVQYHFVWNCMTKGKLGLEKVSSADNVVDRMTMSLPADQFQSIRHLMGVEIISAQL